MKQLVLPLVLLFNVFAGFAQVDSRDIYLELSDPDSIIMREIYRNYSRLQLDSIEQVIAKRPESKATFLSKSSIYVLECLKNGNRKGLADIQEYYSRKYLDTFSCIMPYEVVLCNIWTGRYDHILKMVEQRNPCFVPLYPYNAHPVLIYEYSYSNPYLFFVWKADSVVQELNRAELTDEQRDFLNLYLTMPPEVYPGDNLCFDFFMHNNS